MKDIISIILPVYNTEKYLTRCFDSIKRQTFKNFECLVIDDASTDSSLCAARAAISGDDRFKLICNKKNLGLSNTRNIGIDRSSGRYLFFLDSDDSIDSKTLEVLYNETHDEFVRIMTNVIYEPSLKHDKIWGHATGCLYDKELLKDIRFIDVKFEDLFFNLELLFAGLLEKDTNTYLYYYNKNNESSILHTTKLTKEDKCLLWDTLEYLIEKYKPSKIKEEFARNNVEYINKKY